MTFQDVHHIIGISDAADVMLRGRKVSTLLFVRGIRTLEGSVKQIHG